MGLCKACKKVIEDDEDDSAGFCGDACWNDWKVTVKQFKIPSEIEALIHYEVIVSNIGRTYSGSVFDEAIEVFNEGVKQSLEGFRALGEHVTMMRDGEPFMEYTPRTEDEAEDGKLVNVSGRWIRKE